MRDMVKVYGFGDVHPSIDSQIKLLDGEENSVALSADIWLAYIVSSKPYYIHSVLSTSRGREESQVSFVPSGKF